VFRSAHSRFSVPRLRSASTAATAAAPSALVAALDSATASFLRPEDLVGWRQDLDARLARIQQHPEQGLGFIEEHVRQAGLVAIMLLVGASIMWLADRWGAQLRGVDDLGPAGALGIGAAQALALVPGISRSGVSISAGLFVGLDRASAARFSFLMATPVIAGAGLYELRKVVGGGTAVEGNVVPLVVGLLAAMLSGFAAIHFLLRYLRTNSLAVFVAYRVLLAALVIVSLLAR